ncbi:hypothetical protein DFH06DRAFT_1133186 [Mycena polygramma]|nr:hypothetical protein DFH06DRAFT_1133186 [Mycena polygramma]
MSTEGSQSGHSQNGVERNSREYIDDLETDGSTSGQHTDAKQPKVNRDGAEDGNVSVGATRYADWVSSDSEDIESSREHNYAGWGTDETSEEHDLASEDRDDECSPQESSDQSEESDGDDSDSSD